MSRTIIALLSAILLTGCTQVRTLNDGAAGPWRVTMSAVERTHADFQGETAAGLRTVGFCDHQEHEIRLSYDRSKEQVAATAMHELGHKIEREFPRIWIHLDAMDTAAFPCGSDDLHTALRIAAQATKDNK